ncbi:MAG: c-type cytochrome [Fuerstiella sp.]|nr:c-type cytochrome [Fuerstiella sp.]
MLLTALAEKRLAASDIDASSRERLLNHRNEKLRLLAKQFLETTAVTARSIVVDEWQAQIANRPGDTASGKVVFEKRCATCHRLKNTGKSIGADLAALKDRSTGAMVTAILDPNKAVETKFLSYTAVTNDGLTFSGMLLNETGNGVTLMGTDGKEHVLLRINLEELTCSNRSLMPEGLEKDLTPQDLADVIAFVQSSGVKWKQFQGNEPQLITADVDGTLTLSAATAEIYGPSLVFETKHRNLGFWSSTSDYAVWNIDSPKSGHWTVEFEYACDNSTAGNPLKLSTGSRLLTARVPGTGSWDDYRTWAAGSIDLGRGRRQLVVTAPQEPSFALIDLRAIRLIPPK